MFVFKGTIAKYQLFVLLLRDDRAAKHSFLKIFQTIGRKRLKHLQSDKDEMQNIQLWYETRILTKNPIIFGQFSSNLNSGMILLSSTIFTGHFRLHLEALWHNLVAILSRQHEMTVVIRQEAKFSFMPEILAADIVVGACEGKKNCFLVGLLGDPEATCCCLFLLSLLCFPISWLLNILKH